MATKCVCDLCDKEITYVNDPNRGMKYRHDSYCTDHDGKKQHVGDVTHNISITVDVLDNDHNIMDVCKNCLLEIIKQM